MRKAQSSRCRIVARLFRKIAKQRRVAQYATRNFFSSFAIIAILDHLERAFQASSPKNFPRAGLRTGPFFLSSLRERPCKSGKADLKAIAMQQGEFECVSGNLQV
jgi:hypothetical protein